MSDPTSNAPTGSKPSSTSRGALKIFLGFAPGVGKTFEMLEEAHRRCRRGQDVVVGVVDSRGRADTLEEAKDLEPLPLLPNGELDVQAAVARRPSVVLVDDLEHTNAAGSEKPKRWQDVEALRDAGINVLTTMNVHSLESLNDQIKDITGTAVTDTVPDQILHSADEIELVDLTPRALINRLERGDVYPKESIDQATLDFYREGNLSALREIAMREAAGRVDEDLTEYRRVKHIEKPWATSDRVMICIAPNRNSLRLIRKGWRVGQRLRGEVVAVHVEEKSLTDSATQILKDDFALAERLGIKTVVLKGEVGEALIEYAKGNNITQILLGHPERTRFQAILKESLVNELARSLRNVDITLVAAEVQKAAH